jgi:hypothetical protein
MSRMIVDPWLLSPVVNATTLKTIRRSVEMLSTSLSALGGGCSLIGISKSSILETDALAGVTVLSGVGFRSPHNGCQG